MSAKEKEQAFLYVMLGIIILCMLGLILNAVGG
jgi:hypothetical protein